SQPGHHGRVFFGLSKGVGEGGPNPEEAKKAHRRQRKGRLPERGGLKVRPLSGRGGCAVDQGLGLAVAGAGAAVALKAAPLTVRPSADSLAARFSPMPGTRLMKSPQFLNGALLRC